MNHKFIVIPIAVDGDDHGSCSTKCNYADFWLKVCGIFNKDISTGRCDQCKNFSLYSKSALKYFERIDQSI